MRTDDLESAFAIRKASVTDSSAVSVECPLLKSDWLKSSWLFCERNNVAKLCTLQENTVQMFLCRMYMMKGMLGNHQGIIAEQTVTL